MENSKIDENILKWVKYLDGYAAVAV